VRFLRRGDPLTRLTVRRVIDFTSNEFHPATNCRDPCCPTPRTGVNDEAARWNKGSDEMNRFVQSLLPGMMFFIGAIALENVPNCLGKTTRSLPEHQKRLPRIDHPLVVNSALALIVDDCHAPDIV
jgi:hypothetical protein